MRRLALLFCLAVSLVFAASAAAAPPSPGNEAGHDILGVVPVHGQAGKPGGSGSNLTYHFGPVMTTNQTYANQPYTMTVPAACGSGQSPNGNDADSTINVVSHEHNESITDPFGTAWYDRRGYENGDKCAWNFGTALGTNANGRYNQLINGHD